MVERIVSKLRRYSAVAESLALLLLIFLCFVVIGFVLSTAVLAVIEQQSLDRAPARIDGR